MATITPSHLSDNPRFAKRPPKETIAAVGQRLEIALKSSLAPLIVSPPVAYIDTFTISTPDRIPRAFRRKLAKTCGDLRYNKGKWIYWAYCGTEYGRLQRSRLRIHQPSADTIRLIAQSLPAHDVWRLDVGLDFLTRTRGDADRVNRALSQWLTVPRRGRDWRVEDWPNTTYFRAPGPQTGRYLLGYSDKPSKVTGGPCAHFDLRTFSKQACQRRGVHTVLDLFTFDVRAYIDCAMRLSEIRWRYAAELRDEEARKYAQTFRDQARRDRRPVSPAFGQIAITHRLVRSIAVQLLPDDADDMDTPTWDELQAFPVQRILDAGNYLRDALVNRPAKLLYTLSGNVAVGLPKPSTLETNTNPCIFVLNLPRNHRLCRPTGSSLKTATASAH